MYIVLINNTYLTSFDTIEEAEEGESSKGTKA